MAPRFPVSIKGVLLVPGRPAGPGGPRVALLENERGEWELPGGKLERGEAPETCLVREIREELGVTAMPGPLLDVWLYRLPAGAPESEVLIVTYGCRAEPFDEVHWSAEHRGGRLASLDELTGLPMPEGYRRSIRAWAATSGGPVHADARSAPAMPAGRQTREGPLEGLLPGSPTSGGLSKSGRTSIFRKRGSGSSRPSQAEEAGLAMLDRLLETRRTHRKAPLPSPSIGLDVAYRIQDQLREALVARGEQVIGWKAGLTGRIAQETTGIHHPVSGFLLGDGVYATGDAVPLSRFAELVVEVEIAFLMRKDLAGPGVTPAAALLAVEGALPALELPDLRWDGKPTGGDLVADGVAGNAIVLGQPLTPVVGLDLALEGVVYEMSGRVMATNTAAEVLGNPLNSLAWLANHLGERGLGLRAGDLVMSGSISALLRPKAGDVVTARFTRLGSVSARFI